MQFQIRPASKCHRRHDRRSTPTQTVASSTRTLSCLTSSLSIPGTRLHSLGNGGGCDNFKHSREFQILVRRKRWLFPPPCAIQTGCASALSTAVSSLSDVASLQCPDASGYRIVADKEIQTDSTIVICPFELAITKELATHAASVVLNTNEIPSGWTERQLICTYVCLHWVFEA